MARAIKPELIRNLASLSRIEIEETAIESLAPQLAEILDYFVNILLQDKPLPSLKTEEALSNAPDRDGDLFKVPKVLGES